MFVRYAISPVCWNSIERKKAAEEEIEWVEQELQQKPNDPFLTSNLAHYKKLIATISKLEQQYAAGKTFSPPQLGFA